MSYTIAIPEYLDILSEKHLKEIQKFANITFYQNLPASEEEIVKRIGSAEVVIVKWLRLDESILKQLPNLKYIITLSVGYNQLPVAPASKLGIKIINCPVHSAHAVVEHTFALLFSLSRKITEANKHFQINEWKKSPNDFEGIEVTGKKLLVIGNGKIGKSVAELAKGFGMVVDVTDSNTSSKQLHQLIKSADFITLHAPLTPATNQLMNKEKISLMKPTAYLINTARGEIVEQEALYEALKENRLAGAGLDVFEDEPITGALPEKIASLVKLPNVVATPHIGYNTKEASYRLGEELLQNLENLFKDTPTNIVN